MLRIPEFRSCLLLVDVAQIGAPFDDETAAVNPQTAPKRRRRWAAALRLWAAASVCLAFGGAMAAENIPEVCLEADLRLTTRIEAHGEAQDVAGEVLAKAFFTVLQARRACNQGQVETAMKLYDSIPLGPVMSEIAD
ncbi:MAG TPA: hypothetical protein VFI58_08880 [Xanthobacteraceae bacterium]|jgi:hypothetical protein|nr:hypothetical protein [Xanthobacteraceae bacterium]